MPTEPKAEEDYFKGTLFIMLLALYVVIAFELGKDIGLLIF